MDTKIEEKSDVDVLITFDSNRELMLKEISSMAFRNMLFKDKLFEIDYGCTYRMGYYPSDLGLYNTDYICKNCSMARQLFEDETTISTDGSVIPYVDKIRLQAEVEDINSTEIESNRFALTPIFNAYVQNIILGKVFSKYGMMYHKIYTLYRCGSKIFTVNDDYAEINFRDVDPIKLITCIVLIYSILSEVSFSGIMDANNLVIIPKKTTVVYNGISYLLPYIVTFNNYSTVSCIYNNIAIQPVEREMISILDISFFLDGKKSSGDFDVIVLNNENTSSSFVRFLYHKQEFSFICFYYTLISMLFDKEFYEKFFSSTNTTAIWEKIFGIYSDIVKERIYEDEDAVKILVGIPLKRNVLESIRKLL
jgi:hypothetical protein